MHEHTPPATNEDAPHQAAVVQMTMDAWKRTHRDFKTTRIGTSRGRWVLRMGPRGTTFVPVQIIKE